jgi:hypothetical protein
MSEDGGRMALGYYWSILAMMSAPFLLIALVAGLIWRASRRAGRAS